MMLAATVDVLGVQPAKFTLSGLIRPFRPAAFSAAIAAGKPFAEVAVADVVGSVMTFRDSYT